MKCPNCGAEVTGNFCSYCGTAIHQNNKPQNQNNTIQQDVPTYNNTLNMGRGVHYNNIQASTRKKHTGFAIAAFFLSFFGPIGIVLAIIDLVKDKEKVHKHGLSIAAIVIGVIILLIAFSPSSGSKDSNIEQSTNQETGKESEKQTESVEATVNETAEEAVSEDVFAADTSSESAIATAADFKNMKVGDIGKRDNVYAGLSYVKRMSYLPTELGENNDITAGHEVIMAFFDFYNDSDKESTVSPEDITCYADGVQTEDVDQYINVECDGINQYYSAELADHTQMITVQDYEVPTNWSELKFFYKSELIWTVTQDDIKTDDFAFKSMYDAIAIRRNAIGEGTVIFNDGYEIVFQGVTDYVYQNSITGAEPYTVFKYTINNTGTSAVDYSLAGYSMNAYIDNYYAGDASYIFDEKIDGYSNIFNIDNIEAGMSANIYVAFEGDSKGKPVYMIYDDGYIIDDVRGTVYVER
ncbi:zinc ribbon domain-containing protein [Butyrivibrio sp. WCE2006]|uniref:zinc ribbon domain-containing protein n=1 Tax=Butyrivibrio sp. WCE2006 TaxID=1410611 RepID=UPI0005D1A7A5|nr:zinc ribbon domain-containing protein [Butyrivibrio sp. WCE2006]